MNANNALRNGYDAFISHNHADKTWSRELARRLAGANFNGRLLRPWLDEQFLDPGELGQTSELTSALDRSRTLLLVLSPASVASKWVEFELDYFLRNRSLEQVVPVVLNARCEPPLAIADAKPVDFVNAAAFESAFGILVARLCPRVGPGVADAEEAVEHAWSAALDADPGGFYAESTPERDALLAALLGFDIDDPAGEGLALTGFWHAARLLLRDHQREHRAAYNMKMLLGECLVVAVHRHARYRQVAQGFLDLESVDSEDLVLAFVVARAYSKLAEIDPSLIDLGVLLRIATRLDERASFNDNKVTVAMLVGRLAAKLRGTDLGDLLIQTLSEGGAAARIAAIAGISMAQVHAPSVFYLSDLAAMYATPGGPKSATLEPPSRKLQALLFAIDLDQPAIVRQLLERAKEDMRRAFAIDDLPYGHSWFLLRREPPADHAHLAPFMGTVVKVTAANMEEVALRLDASHLVCLTEPRIVDALLDRAGSVLIPSQDADSPQCRRLASRGVPFAMLDADRMAELKDGDHVEIEGSRSRIVSQR